MTNPLDRLAEALKDRYTLERELGQGGMATVYLAHDLKHDRKVAIKVLRPELAAVLGAERFVQEIKTTANLQHPNILPLFDSGEADGFLYYVMPYVEGETLRAKLNRETQLGVEEAVKLTTEVADALEYAHQHGVIHRDIKPENILLHAGRPLVADFGIALAVSAAAGGRMTETGLSLGTPHYMSPEQATADKQITHRSDVYSLGAVLYEMLTGEPPHTGSSAQAIILKIVSEEVLPVTRLRKAVPANVAAAVAQALEKLPADRFASAGELSDVLAGKRELHVAAAVVGRRVPRRLAHRFVQGVPWGLALILALTSSWLAIHRESTERTLYLNVALPDTAPLVFVGEAYFGVGQPAFALSPDASSLVYVAQVGKTTQLYLRPASGHDFRPLVGTEGAYAPFFSPNAQWIGFFVGDQLKRISVSDGQVLTVAETNDPYGGSWGEDDRIAVVTLDGGGLGLVPAAGGRVDPLLENVGVAFPQWLPGGEWLLLACLGPEPHPCVVSARTREVRRLVAGMDAVPATQAVKPILGTFPRYVAPGYLVFSAPGENVLMGARFDAGRLRVASEPIPLFSRVRREGYIGALQLAVSGRGDLAYVAGNDAMAGSLVWVDGEGRLDTLSLPASVYGQFALSPDGARLAVTVMAPPSTHELWFYDLDRLDRGGRRWTGELGLPGFPVWDATSSSVFVKVSEAPSTIVRINGTSASGADTVVSAPGYHSLREATTDGRFPAVREVESSPGRWQVSLVAEAGLDSWARGSQEGPAPVLASPAVIAFPEVSPNLEWMTYTSAIEGPYEVFALPLKRRGPAVKVSNGGGAEATWTRRGDALFYRSGRYFYRVAFSGQDRAPFGVPELFVEGEFLDVPGMEYAVSQDGTKLLLLQGPPEKTTTQLNVITNWALELQRRIR